MVDLFQNTRENQINREKNLKAGEDPSQNKSLIRTKLRHWKRECPKRRNRNSTNIATEPKKPSALATSVKDTKQ